MTEAELLRLIEGGENIQVEFKKSTTEITKDGYDTVCSFSNREGGTIVLGVKDNGESLGIAPDAADRMKKDFVTSINNGQKINPPLYLQPETCTVDGRTLLIIHVPSGSQVCRHHGRIFDRSHEADIGLGAVELEYIPAFVFKINLHKVGDGSFVVDYHYIAHISSKSVFTRYIITAVRRHVTEKGGCIDICKNRV